MEGWPVRLDGLGLGGLVGAGEGRNVGINVGWGVGAIFRLVGLAEGVLVGCPVGNGVKVVDLMYAMPLLSAAAPTCLLYIDKL